MAHTVSSRGDQTQLKGYSSPYDQSPNHLNNSSSSMPCFSSSRGVEFRDKYVVEGFSPYSSCSSSYHSVGSPSGWQLSNPNPDVHFKSSIKNCESSTSLVDLTAAQMQQISHESGHVQCSSSDFTNVGTWQQLLDPSICYISTGSNLIPNPSSLALPAESSGTPPAVVEGAILRELLGRIDNNNCSSSVPSLVTGSVQPHLGSPIANGGCSWNQIDASTNVGAATSSCVAHFPSDPGFVDRAARFSSLSNISQVCHSFPSNGPVNMNLSPEASQFIDNSSAARQASLTPGGTPQSSPKPNCNINNGGNKFPPCENVVRLESVKEFVVTGEIPGDDLGNPMHFHPVNPRDEAMPLQNGASPANSSGSGQFTALHGLFASKGRLDTQIKKRQRCASDEKPRDNPSLSETTKKKVDEAKAKRQKGLENAKVKEEPKSKAEKSSSEDSGNLSPISMKENPKPPEPPKPDYIHVRARRGQATDSHSLAERVRREKISERMKFLQDLVPGCNKVTGKALMLDEIINYVQSLQRQVELLSMKLAAVNPRLDFNIENLLTKEMLSSFCPAPPVLVGSDGAANHFQLHPTQQNPIQLGLSNGSDLRSSSNAMEATLRRSMASSIAVGTHANSGSQASGVWDGELQSVVQMGLGSGILPSGQMKIEL